MSARVDIFKRQLVLVADSRAWSQAPVLLMTACDQAYLPHAIALARSLNEFAPGSHLLVHIINPQESSLELFRAQATLLESLRLHVSTEEVTLPTSVSKTAYYASARFLRMAELLAGKATVPVLALDADALAVGPLSLDFSDKPEAEICLRRRDSERPIESHLRVAAGAVWVRPSRATRAFFDAVAGDLEAAFSSGQAEWFVDQRILGDHVEAETGGAKIRNLKSKFADWDFGDDAVFWMGKGERKYLDVRYLLLRDGFDADPVRREAARALHARYASLIPGERADTVMQRAQRSFRRARPMRSAIYLPRLDLPWKRTGMLADGGPALLSEDTIEVRLWWKRFAMQLAHALTHAGAEPVLIEIPAWEITPERIDDDDVDLAFVAHRSCLDFAATRTPRRFFMQQYFRSVFVLDRDGWSAGSSVYPVDAEALPPAVLGAWDDYRAAFSQGTLGSKFGQAKRRKLAELQATGALPQRPYLFMPIQVPHDQSIGHFSDVSMDQALAAAATLAKAEGLALVLKAHPANPASMRPFRERYRGADVAWTEAHVHDVVLHAQGTLTINSGVGFEALLAGRPVVCLGRAEYDAAAHSARLDNLAAVWKAAVTEPKERRLRRYARFVDWFLGRYAIDLSRPMAGRYVMDRLVGNALAEARLWRDGSDGQ